MGPQEMIQELGHHTVSSQKLYPGIGADKGRREIGNDDEYIQETAAPDFQPSHEVGQGSPSAAARAVETTVTFRELIMVPQ